MSKVSHGEVASNHDTTSDGFEAPGQDKAPSRAPTAQLSRLIACLEENFPREMERSNSQNPEAPADIAIRLLQGFAANRPPEYNEHCREPYCNRPLGHTGGHGVVQYDPGAIRN